MACGEAVGGLRHTDKHERSHALLPLRMEMVTEGGTYIFSRHEEPVRPLLQDCPLLQRVNWAVWQFRLKAALSGTDCYRLTSATLGQLIPVPETLITFRFAQPWKRLIIRRGHYILNIA